MIELVKTNTHDPLARVRLVVFRGDGGLYDLHDHSVNFIIQSWSGNAEFNLFNEAGLRLEVFTEASVSADVYSPIKSNNYLRYAMGALFVKRLGLDDCILTNAFSRVADSTIANIFIIENGTIKTPLLTEGPVNGVMRQFLLESFKRWFAFMKQQLALKTFTMHRKFF